MALPNLVGLIILSGLIARETKAYLDFDPKLKASPDQIDQFLIDSNNPWRTDPNKMEAYLTPKTKTTNSEAKN